MVYLSFRENLNLKSFSISDSEYLLMEFVKLCLKTYSSVIKKIAGLKVLFSQIEKERTCVFKFSMSQNLCSAF